MSQVYSVPDIVPSALCASSHSNRLITLGDNYSPPITEREGGDREMCSNFPQITF